MIAMEDMTLIQVALHVKHLVLEVKDNQEKLIAEMKAYLLKLRSTLRSTPEPDHTSSFQLDSPSHHELGSESDVELVTCLESARFFPDEPV